MRYLVLSLCACLASVGWAGEPRISLEKWTTTDGKTAEAAFQSIDEKAGTVTILVPRTIELARLDNVSRDLATRLSTKVIQPTSPELPEDQPAEHVKPVAMIVGLDEPTFVDWSTATYEQKVGTMASLLHSVVLSGLAGDDLRREVWNVSNFNSVAAKMVTTADALMVRMEKEMSMDAKISDVLIGVFADGGLLRTNFQQANGMLWHDLTLRPSGSSVDLIGRVKNLRKDGISMGTFNIEVERDGKLVEVVPVILADLPAGETKSFSSTLYGVDFVPSLSQIKITESSVVKDQ